MRRDLLPFAIGLLMLVLAFRLALRRRGNVRLRPRQMQVFRILTHNRYKISRDYPGDRSELLAALEESRRLFREARNVKPLLDALLEGVARAETAEDDLERRMTETLQAMARYLRLDADFLTQSIR